MRKIILNITTLLLISAAFVGCNVGILDDKSKVLDGDGVLIINGTVSDKADGSPLEDIKIVFNAYPSKGDKRSALTLTEYTSSKGVFIIRAEGFSDNVHCVISAEDDKGIYSSSYTDINVTWCGTAYDINNNSFVVNDCNFHLSKK